MDPSVYRIFRESLEYAAARSCGKPYQPAKESDREIIGKAERLSGVSDNAGQDYDGLISIFNIINPDKPRQFARENVQGMFGGYQVEPGGGRTGKYQKWAEEAGNVQDNPEYAQARLELFEDCFSTVPSPLPGVSCYHWGKTVAALACCLAYNSGRSVSAGKPFALYSIDFSGIQNFIYTIIAAGALKALKTRSLYLSVMTEHISDTILEACGLPRCNLIYAGGGRAHILLSADPEMTVKADKVVSDVNVFLKKNFGTSLYLASGWTEAGEEDIHSDNGTKASFSELFRNTSRKISENKLRRYGYKEILELNREPVDRDGRTCAVCGRSTGIVSWRDKHLCRTCASLENFSVTMTDDSDSLYIIRGQADNGLPVPGPDGEIYSLIAAKTTEDQIIRRYTVNHRNTSGGCIRIFLSRHHAKALEDGSPATFATMADASKGIKRLGVFRGDVDSLGTLFANGFYRRGEAKPWKNCNISYYSALSGAMTWFFQRDLDRVLREGAGDPLLRAKPAGEQVTVVYAGGDDVFLIGAWNDILDAGLRIQDAFGKYTGGSVTLSGGYSFFPEHTPVPIMADSTADLEEEAKQKDGKNAIALFGADTVPGGDASAQCFGWDEFRKDVLADKFTVMADLFNTLDDKGNSFLYRVLGYFRQTLNDPMAISRLAYLLARHKPSVKSGATKEMVAAYDGFMKKVYKWALDPKDNRAFRTACLIYVYLNRQGNEKQ